MKTRECQQTKLFTKEGSNPVKFISDNSTTEITNKKSLKKFISGVVGEEINDTVKYSVELLIVTKGVKDETNEIMTGKKFIETFLKNLVKSDSILVKITLECSRELQPFIVTQ